MKQLAYVFLTLLLTSFFSCGRNRAERQYERFLEDSDRMEFITPTEDTVAVVEDEEEPDWMNDDDGLVSIPDIPQERSVDMGASDYELEKIMTGRGD
ncbi:MAG: hypothetical protein IJ067_02145 [Prevotella sp.]|nr:hypothetical protein [Prevotella sp.]